MFFHRSGWCICLAFTLVLSQPVQSADPAFVGLLAELLDDDVARKLSLAEETRSSLTKLADDREAEVLNLVLQIKDLPADEKTKRLAPFVAASEKAALSLLTDPQRKRFQQIRVERAGLSSLVQPAIAAAVKLTAEQLAQIKQLVDARESRLEKAPEAEKQKIHDEVERQLRAVLQAPQLADWEVAAGLRQADPEGNDAVAQADSPAPAEDAPKPAEPRPAEPKTPAADPTDADQSASPEPAKDGKLRFAFQFQPWKDVLGWFAEQNGLSLQMDAPPPGTCNYTDRRYYSPAQALDVMNGLLLSKGYTLVRREQTLFVLNLEDKVPDILVPYVPLADLDERGEFELVRSLFPLGTIDPDDAEDELSQLIGPQGALSVLPSARHALIQETAGKLRTIREMLAKADDPASAYSEKIEEFVLKHISAAELLAIARPLLGLEEDANTNDEVRIAADELGGRVLVTGTPEKIARMREIVPLVDKALDASGSATPVEQHQLEAYEVLGADAATALAVLQTLLAGQTGARLAVDPQTNKVIAMATPTQHKMIVATLGQLKAEAVQFEVIQLRRHQPESIVAIINKMFKVSEGEDGVTNGPIVDGEPTTMQLWVRGTAGEIAQIKQLVGRLEGDPEDDPRSRVPFRILPFEGSSAQMLLDNADIIWPTMRKNKIRVVTPSALLPALRQLPITRPREPSSASPADNSQQPAAEKPREVERFQPAEKTQPPEESKPAAATTNEARVRSAPTIFRLASQRQPADSQPSDIVISVTPQGLLIASEDLDALDEFENLLRQLMASIPESTEPAVFFLKYSKADPAAQLLRQVLGISQGAGGGAGGGLVNDLASAALGDVGGGLVGGLLGLGGGGGTLETTGSISIVADTRLNALIVQANAVDLDLVQRLLTVIDRQRSPEDVQTVGKPRLVPLLYTSATEIAEIVKTQYSSRLEKSEGSGQQRQPSPQEFIRALRGGGRGGAGGGGQETPDQEPKMSVGVDARSNSLIVTAPDPLFEEVRTFVEQLDQAGIDSTEVVRIVSPRGATADLIQKSLSSLFGKQVTVNTTSSESRTPTSGNTTNDRRRQGDAAPQGDRSTGGNNTDNASRDAIRQMIFERLRGGGGGGGGGNRGGGNSGGGGRPGGGPRRPGR